MVHPLSYYKAVTNSKREDQEEFSKIVKQRALDLKKAALNVGAQTAGLPGDMGQIASDVGLGVLNASYDAIDPTGQIRETLQIPTDLDYTVPFNSEEVANLIGGDPSHWSWFISGLMAPGPGEVKGMAEASLIGLVGFQRAYKTNSLMMKSYKDFLKLEKQLGGKPMDMRTATETGWVRGHDGSPKFFISDKDMVIRDLEFTEGPNIIRLGDLIEHQALFKVYPDLAEVRFTVHANKNGKLYHPVPKDAPAQAELLRKPPTFHDEITIYGAASERDFKGSLLHELQHIIQEVEGWSSGTGTYTQKHFEQIAEQVMMLKVLKHFPKEELNNSVAVTRFIRELGGPDTPKQLESNVRQYAKMVEKFDDFSYNDELSTLEKVTHQSIDNANHVFELLLQRGDADDIEKLNTLIKGLKTPELLEQMSSRAYRLKLGEVESRLATATQQWDDAQWRMAGKEDPLETLLRTEGGDSTEDILIGKRGDMLEKSPDAIRRGPEIE